MNAEPPVARFQMVHQPRRPGYAKRYPAGTSFPMDGLKLRRYAFLATIIGTPVVAIGLYYIKPQLGVIAFAAVALVVFAAWLHNTFGTGTLFSRLGLIPPAHDENVSSTHGFSWTPILLLILMPPIAGVLTSLALTTVLNEDKFVPAITCILCGILVGIGTAFATTSYCYEHGTRLLPCAICWCWTLLGIYSTLMAIFLAGDNRPYFDAVWKAREW